LRGTFAAAKGIEDLRVADRQMRERRQSMRMNQAAAMAPTVAKSQPAPTPAMVALRHLAIADAEAWEKAAWPGFA
jgi:hypothetical protein